MTSPVADLVTKFEALMKQKDGTSRFVALFLLLEILGTDQEAATKCWSMLDPAFLDKLVLAKQSKATSEEEARDLQAMGCSILQAYMSNDKVVRTPVYLKRSDALMKLFIRGIATEEVKIKVSQVLQTIASTSDGATTIISSPVFDDFAVAVINGKWTDGVSVLTSTTIHGILTQPTTADLFTERITKVISLVVESLDNTSALFRPSLRFLRSVIGVIAIDRLDLFIKDDSLTLIRTAITTELSNPSRSKDLSDLFILLASLMRYRGHSFILRNDKDVADQQLFLLISALAATEIRASLAGLVKPDDVSSDRQARMKVASCYDIIRIMCLYLVTVETLSLKPDDILKLRDNFSAVFGETVSYLRDRWDNSPVSPDYTIHTGRSDTGSKHDSELLQDPTIISGTQSLALWLQEDESAHQDAAGIIDVLLGLVKESEREEIDYGSWILPAVSALLEHENGRAQFSACNGTRVVLDRLNRLASMARSYTIDLSIPLREAQVELEILQTASPSMATKWESANRGLVARIEQAG